MYKRLLTHPFRQDKSIFLFGPRGTGKTTLLQSFIKQSIYIDLLDFTTYRDLLANPSRLRNQIPENYKGWIIIDEVQKIPALLNEIHRLIERDHVKFILTGSSARSLRKKGVNLLAGRALTYHLFPLTACELSANFSLTKSLQYGHLPAIFSEPSPQEYLQSYLQTYLKEEIIQEGITRNLTAFSYFLEVVSFSQGSLINSTEIGKEIGIDRKTVENYLCILEDLLIATRLTVFSRKAERRLVTHSKFYFFDAGVFRHIRPQGPLDKPSEIDGATLETLIFQEIIAINHYFQYEYSINFWRTSAGAEVDFVLYGPHGLIAIEVKNSAKIHTRDFKSLKLFQEDYPMAKLFLLNRGSRKEYFDNIQVWPVEEFLKSLREILEQPT